MVADAGLVGPGSARQADRVFHTLDVLRGFAAICVVAFHMQGDFLPITVAGGYLAVDLFFIMSGVVLSHAYEARFRAGMGTVEFMRLRLIRLYPLYLLGTVFGILVTVASLMGRNSADWDVHSIIQAAALGLVFLPNFSGEPMNTLFPLNIPCWSLFLEIVVNLLFVAFWRLLTLRRLVVVVLIAAVVLGWGIARSGHADQGATPETFLMGLVRTLFGFCVGVLIARGLRHAPRMQSSVLVMAIVAVLAFAIMARPTAGTGALWDAACILIVFPLLVWCGTRVDPGGRASGIAAFLGVTSYAVYVLHSPLSAVLNSLKRFLGGTILGLGAPWLGLAVLVGLLAGCWLVDRYYDAPVRRWLARLIPHGGSHAPR